MPAFSAAPDEAAFHAHGFFVVPGLFDAAEVAVVRAAFDALHARAQELRATQTERDALFVLKARDADVVVQRIVWAGGAAPALLRIGNDPRLVTLALRLLGTQACDQLLNQAHFKMPGDGVAFDWHQDIQHRDKGVVDGRETWRDVTGRGSYVQTILLVDDMTADNGPLQFLPGDAVPLDERGRLKSAHDDYSASTPPGATLLPTSSSTSTSIDASRAITVTGRAGDVLVFGPYAVHGSLPNTSTTPRRVLINGYAAPGANGRVYPGAGLGVRLPR